jgi:hypothetical protein
MNLENNGIYIHCASGSVEIEGNIIASGDALGIYETDLIKIKAKENSELIFVEVPMKLGIML